MKYVTMTNTNFSKMELTEGFIDKLLDYMDNGVQLNGLDKTSVEIVEVFFNEPPPQDVAIVSAASSMQLLFLFCCRKNN